MVANTDLAGYLHMLARYGYGQVQSAVAAECGSVLLSCGVARWVLLAAAAAVAFPAPSIAAGRSVPPSRDTQMAPRYAVAGLWIVDRQHRRLVLRGVDVSGAEFTPTDQPLPYSATDLATIRATGATVVRVPVAWAQIEPAEGHYDPAALARVDQIVEWAGNAGLRVILDMHQWHWSPCFGGNGMPAWATDPCPHDSSASDVNTPQEAAAETGFWTSAELQRRFADAWAAVVGSLRAIGHGSVPSYVLGYDLLNEPAGGYLPPGVFDNVTLPAFYRTVTAAVRAVDPGALVFVEPPLLADPARTTMSVLGISRAVYSPHLYGDSFNDAAGDAGDILGPSQFLPDLTLGEGDAQRLHAAFWPGEWGDLNPSATVSYRETQYAADMLSAQDQLMVGSAYWAYWAPGGWPWTPDVQAVLTRPSPFAIAGRPIAFQTSPGGLRLSWVSDGGTTVVSVPTGWTAKVSVLAGSVRWYGPSPGWVMLRAAPGTNAVVEVTSAGGG